ncbi:hypothetical protein ATCC90586_005288 [Pythium insidiosum]|nr:hypothetical protein ATCC90586_005288 [Pythium insidiosum]
MTTRALARRCVLSRARGLRAAHSSANSSSAQLFGFVHELADDPDALVARSKQTLERLHKEDDVVRLRLPTDSDAAAHPMVASLSQTAVIELHNPSARNALSGRMMAQLADIVATLEDPAVHGSLTALVLGGSGGWFCAGADLRVAKQELGSREAGIAMGALMVDTLTRLRRLPLVSIALVSGGAFGGGAELATACDFRVMANNAVIQFVQAKMGVSPGWGGGARLHKVVGRQQALRLLCTAERLNATRAQSIGLVDAVFDGESSAAEACAEFVRPFDCVTPEVSHGAKRLITNADDVSLDEVLEFEHRVFAALWGGPANLKALENALRKPK